jgi:LacI family transcriptional regulator
MAAEYFLNKLDYPNHAFIGASSEWEWSRMREREFVAELKRHGRHCAVYTMTTDFAMSQEQTNLGHWMRQLPKPLSLFVACDRCAHDVLVLSHKEQIRVPEEIAVLSVDNEVMICTRTHPTLTSIQPDFELGGYQAADLLNRMMTGKEAKRRSVLVPVKRIVERGSTAPCCMAGRMVQRACEFIGEKACEGIGVEDVAHHLNVSRSLADLRFRQVKGQSILSVIQVVRLEHVARLLRTTALPIKDIGELCGFGNENYLKQRFKKSFGVTMREYRKNLP